MASSHMKDLMKTIMQQAAEKGWGTTPAEIDVAHKLLLINSEVSEAYDACRKKNIDGKDGFEEELCDVVHRALHLCGIFGIDVEKKILEKIEYNKGREWT